MTHHTHTGPTLTAGPIPERNIHKAWLHYAPMWAEDTDGHHAGDPLDPKHPHQLVVIKRTGDGMIVRSNIWDGWMLALVEQMLHATAAEHRHMQKLATFGERYAIPPEQLRSATS